MTLSEVEVRRILTRTSGYLKTVTSHSLQPYRGCTLGRSLCGVGCYVQHNPWLTRGRAWGEFLEVRVNAVERYGLEWEKEGGWARRRRSGFSIFLSSSTEPFLPQERRYGITRGLLRAMLERPPDALVLQTHSHRVAAEADLLVALAAICRLRVHISIESDRDTLRGLPPPASSVEARFQAAQRLKARGILTVITASPLLPIARPEDFFKRVAECADAVVLDHFIGGDGSSGGTRTLKTPLPAAMARTTPESATLDYRDRMAETASRHLPGKVGVGIDGFAARYGIPPLR